MKKRFIMRMLRRTLLNNISRGNVFQGQLVKISRNLPPVIRKAGGVGLEVENYILVDMELEI